MFKKFAILTAIVSLFAVGTLSAFAQNGRGPGGPGGPNNTPGDPNCDDQGICEPQFNENAHNRQSGRQANSGRNAQNFAEVTGSAGRGGDGLADMPAAYDGELPQHVIDLLIEAWLDEQHAYAFYGAVMAQFGAIRPFTNIQRAEAQHAAALEFLFERYDIDTPELPQYQFPQLVSIAEACQLSVEAEIDNFSLFDAMLAAFEPYPDIYRVALSLRDASEFRHLPAFENCAGR